MFNICASESAGSDAHSLKTQGAILSGPGELLGLSFRRRCLTSIALQLILSSFSFEFRVSCLKFRTRFSGHFYACNPLSKFSSIVSSVDYLINVLKVQRPVFSEQFSGKARCLKLSLSWHIIQVVQLLKIFQGLHFDCFLVDLMFLQIILVQTINIYIKFCFIFLCNTGSPNSIPNSCSN